MPPGSLPDLAELDALLVREGMARSPDVWLSVHTLLARRASQGKLPGDAHGLAAILAPVICKSPQQQAQFKNLVEEWLRGKPPSNKAVIASPAMTAAARARRWLGKFNRLSIAMVTATLLIAAAAGLTIAYRPPTVPPQTTQQNEKTAPPRIDRTPAITDAVKIEDYAAPNTLPMSDVLPPSWQVIRETIGTVLPSLPWGAVLIWLVWRYWGRWVLRRQAPEGQSLLRNLHLELAHGAPFSGCETTVPLREMKRPSWQPSRRLHLPASVEATVRRAGLFTPRYRQRQCRAAYVVLVRTHHRDDQSAQFAELLLHKLHEEKLAVRGYRFRHDPRRLTPWNLNPRDSAYPLSLAKLAERFHDSRLIVIGEGDILFDPFTGKAREWVDEFKPWSRKVWLSAGDEQGATERLLGARNFRVLPLTGASLGELARWFLDDERMGSPASLDVDEREFPELLQGAGNNWLDAEPPRDTDTTRLIRQLETYLGPEGMLLLRALAVYPQPSWKLTYALDALLFASGTAVATPAIATTHWRARIRRSAARLLGLWTKKSQA